MDTDASQAESASPSPDRGPHKTFPKGQKEGHPPAHPILFFDGVCGLCNGFVDFVIARDPQSHFRFAPLQGKIAEPVLQQFQNQTGHPLSEKGELRSFLLKDGDHLYWKSEAVLIAVQQLGGFWGMARWLRYLPVELRNAVYDFVAKNRYRWFGKKEVCRMPAPAERERFLD
jgi:predicted DCC family thiol-disulfide oxidoreductase YuxK